ncbi:MAG: hypothetical protein WA294_21620 [Acidobacteriaceae bacterium]
MAQKQQGKKPRAAAGRNPNPGTRKHPIDSLFGLLASKRRKTASIEEINEAIERGWAGEK